MIYGIGIDLVRTKRMESSLDRFGNRIAEKVLSARELDDFSHTRQPASFLAKRFAAKEAMAKALGTGFSQRLGLKQIEVMHDDHGKPFIVCSDRAMDLLRKNGIDNVHLSITDEQDNAVALVVLETETHRSDTR